MKEGLEEETNSGSPTVKFIWKDCFLGKNFRSTVDVENSNSLHSLINHFPVQVILHLLNVKDNEDEDNDESEKKNKFADYLKRDYLIQSRCAFSVAG
jgi:hypothetical protein